MWHRQDHRGSLSIAAAFCAKDFNYHLPNSNLADHLPHVDARPIDPIQTASFLRAPTHQRFWILLEYFIMEVSNPSGPSHHPFRTMFPKKKHHPVIQLCGSPETPKQPPLRAPHRRPLPTRLGQSPLDDAHRLGGALCPSDPSGSTGSTGERSCFFTMWEPSLNHRNMEEMDVKFW